MTILEQVVYHHDGYDLRAWHVIALLLWTAFCRWLGEKVKAWQLRREFTRRLKR